MGITGRAAAIGLCLASAPCGQLGLTQTFGGDAPAERITSDTPEFCHHLSSRLAESERTIPPTSAVRALADEGRTMCDHGEVRRGVHRLRRAFRLMMTDEKRR